MRIKVLYMTLFDMKTSEFPLQMMFHQAKYLWRTPLHSFIPMRWQGCCLADGGDTLNRHEAIGVQETFDHKQRTGR